MQIKIIDLIIEMWQLPIELSRTKYTPRNQHISSRKNNLLKQLAQQKQKHKI